MKSRCDQTLGPTTQNPRYLPIVILENDLQNGQNNGPYTAYTLYFGILGHHFGLFWRQPIIMGYFGSYFRVWWPVVFLTTRLSRYSYNSEYRHPQHPVFGHPGALGEEYWTQHMPGVQLFLVFAR